jgi:hypothetical protein
MCWKSDDLEIAREKFDRDKGKGSYDKTNRIQKVCWHLRILIEGFDIYAVCLKDLFNTNDWENVLMPRTEVKS